MTALQNLFTVEEVDRSRVSTQVSLNHNGVKVMSVELYPPDSMAKNGYFSTTWNTSINNAQGRMALAKSYGRTKSQLQYPAWAEETLEAYRKVFEADAECVLTVGLRGNANQDGKHCSLDGRIMEFGVKSNGSAQEVVRDIAEAPEIAKDFEFINLESPYCRYVFGNFAGFGREVGLVSEFNLSEEVMHLFMETSRISIPQEHSKILADKLDELLGGLLKLEPR